MIKIYHNTRCSKSRCALDLLNESGQPYEVVEYLKETPTAAELTTILEKLQMKPEALVRKNEKLFQENYADKTFTDAEWIELLVANPILIERPIVVTDKGAAIGRPVENILKIM